jgi:predicted Zn-dependent protease
MKNIRPLIVTFEPGIELWQQEAVREGIREVFELAKISDKIKIIEDSKIELYLNKGVKEGREGQINADVLADLLNYELGKLSSSETYYKILILNRDIFLNGTNFVIGAVQGSVGVISIFRFLTLNPSDQQECIKTEIIHELGHIFGLIPESRKTMVENSLGLHCNKCCTMRQGLNVPKDWIKISKDRLQYGPFCDICLKDLQSFFSDE